MIDMTHHKFVDLCETQEPKTLQQFERAQKNRREKMSDAIMTASGKSRKNIKSCIDKVLVELRQRIMGEITLEEKRKSTDYFPIQPRRAAPSRRPRTARTERTSSRSSNFPLE